MKIKDMAVRVFGLKLCVERCKWVDFVSGRRKTQGRDSKESH
jgi:hypothetical protein